MKYIKTYEKLNNDPKIGDYVICEEVDKNLEEKLSLFIKNNIGQIVDFRTINNIENEYTEVDIKYNVFVKYKKIPDELYDDFDYHKNIDHCRIFNINEILYSSQNKKELEEILDLHLSQNKFNL